MGQGAVLDFIAEGDEAAFAQRRCGRDQRSLPALAGVLGVFDPRAGGSGARMFGGGCSPLSE